MRWCILPAHTHLQIRLDLHESNAKSAVPAPRVHACARVYSAAVELVFSPRNKHKVYNSDRNQRKQDIPQEARRVAPSPSRRRGTRPFKWYTDQSEVALVQERATPCAQTFLNTRALVLIYSYTIYCYRDTLYKLFYTLEAHLSTLNYTRYGYVKPIVFVNFSQKRFLKKLRFGPVIIYFHARRAEERRSALEKPPALNKVRFSGGNASSRAPLKRRKTLINFSR